MLKVVEPSFLKVWVIHLFSYSLTGECRPFPGADDCNQGNLFLIFANNNINVLKKKRDFVNSGKNINIMKINHNNHLFEKASCRSRHDSCRSCWHTDNSRFIRCNVQ